MVIGKRVVVLDGYTFLLNLSLLLDFRHKTDIHLGMGSIILVRFVSRRLMLSWGKEYCCQRSGVIRKLKLSIPIFRWYSA